MLSLSNILKVAFFEVKKNRSKVEKRVILIMLILGGLLWLTFSVFTQAGLMSTEKYYTFAIMSGENIVRNPSALEDKNKIIHGIIMSTDKFVYDPDGSPDLLVEYVENNLYAFSKNNDRARSALSVMENAIKEFNTLVYTGHDVIYGGCKEGVNPKGGCYFNEEISYPLRIIVTSLEREEKTLQKLIEQTVNVDAEVKEEYINSREADKQVQDEPTADEYVSNIASSVSDSQEVIGSSNNSSVVSEDLDFEEGQTIIFEQANVSSDDLANTESNVDDEENPSLDKDKLLDYAYTSDINPYSQFKVLFIVILMTMPLSMITLIYANSIMAEKINKRGIFLLLAPLKRAEIIIGKTLPYFCGALAALLPIVVTHSPNIENGIFSSLIIFAIIIAYFSIGFLVAMLARSHKELSFLGIFFISLYSCYLLIPAFMLNFSVIALASPLTIVAKYFQSEIVSLQLLAFSILPTLISGLCLYFFGSKLFNDINMFSYRTLSEKISDAISQIIAHRVNIFTIAMAAVPFVFLIELMMIVFLLSLQSWIAIYILMIMAAITEEAFRNLGIYILITQKLEKLTNFKILYYSFLTGLGFFVGEKVLLLIMIAPFVDAYSTLILAGVALPLFLHSLLTFIFGMTTKYLGKGKFFTVVLLTGLLHFFINFAISFIARGGL